MNFYSEFIRMNGVYCQPGFDAGEFEKEYVSIRTKEGRMLDDEVVKRLPINNTAEWKVRRNSAQKLVHQLKKEKCSSVIEIGCGNGWLTNYIHKNLSIPVCGIDVEKQELEQAARVFNLDFIYADIFAIDELKADAIILASCIQYFPDLTALINRLHGLIHIIDSPIYLKGTASAARSRSEAYFRSQEAKGMSKFYHHHEIDKILEYNPKFLYRPNRLDGLMGNSPFPWIRIDRSR